MASTKDLGPILEDALSRFQRCVTVLTRRLDPPQIVQRSGYPVLRHERQDSVLAAVLKCVRLVSCFNASLVLLREGFVQEVGACLRIADELTDDVWFLSVSLGEGGQPSDEQRMFLEEFFQEEFSDPRDPVATSAKRHRISRRRIRSALARLEADGGGAGRSQVLGRTIYNAYSGFVHGAYTHIMELCSIDLHGLAPPHYQMRGVPDRVPEFQDALVHYVYRAIVAAVAAAKVSGDLGTSEHLIELAKGFAAQTGCLSADGSTGNVVPT